MEDKKERDGKEREWKGRKEGKERERGENCDKSER